MSGKNKWKKNLPNCRQQEYGYFSAFLKNNFHIFHNEYSIMNLFLLQSENIFTNQEITFNVSKKQYEAEKNDNSFVELRILLVKAQTPLRAWGEGM